MSRAAIACAWATALLASSILAPAVSAATAAKCGTETARTHGQVTNVRVRGVGCRTGRRVTGDWFDVQQTAKSPNAVTVHDRGHPWECRVTQAATGTDPGYIARTKVRCTHRSSAVTFELRS